MGSRFPGPLEQPNPDGPDFIMTIDEAAEYLQIPKQTLYKWRAAGKGPRAFKLPHTLRYSKRELDRWLISHLDDWGIEPGEVA